MKSKLDHAAAIIAALILLQTLFFKFTGAEESRWIFSQIGAEPFGRIGSGVVELFVALGLIFPVTRALAALGAIGVMLGALATHLLVIGVEVKGDGGLLFSLALVVLLLSVFISVQRRAEYALTLKRLGVFA